jgi:hypothetical protein
MESGTAPEPLEAGAVLMAVEVEEGRMRLHLPEGQSKLESDPR